MKVAQTVVETITSLADQDVQYVGILFANGNTTSQHGLNLKLKGGVNYVGVADETLGLEDFGGVWYGILRSANHA